MVSWLRFFRMASVLAATCVSSPGGAQQVVGSVEAGLQTLAQNLLASAPADRRPPLSILPFPGADQSCPVLSVFVVDELTSSFVTAVQPRPRVVERQQLEAIIAQNQLDEFLTDPEQRRRLGGLSGIGAVVLGTFTPIGDRLRINARMVTIENGETIGAASVSVPRTREMEDLLRQGSGRGQNCLPDVRRAGAATTRTAAAQAATTAPVGAASPRAGDGIAAFAGSLVSGPIFLPTGFPAQATREGGVFRYRLSMPAEPSSRGMVEVSVFVDSNPEQNVSVRANYQYSSQERSLVVAEPSGMHLYGGWNSYDFGHTWRFRETETGIRGEIIGGDARGVFAEFIRDVPR